MNNGTSQTAGVDSAYLQAAQGAPEVLQGLPAQAGNDALSLAQVAGYLNILAGLMLLAALGMFLGGLGQWWAHLGLPARDEGIQWMRRGVTTLFVLVVLLGIVRFIQFHAQFALGALALGILLLGGWAVISIAKATSAGEEDDH